MHRRIEPRVRMASGGDAALHSAIGLAAPASRSRKRAAPERPPLDYLKIGSTQNYFWASIASMAFFSSGSVTSILAWPRICLTSSMYFSRISSDLT